MPQEARAYSAAGGKGILSRRKRSGSGASEDGRCPALRHKQERSQGLNPPTLRPALLIWVFSKQRFQVTQNDRFLISLPGKSSLRGHTQPQEYELLRGLRGWTMPGPAAQQDEISRNQPTQTLARAFDLGILKTEISDNTK